MDHREGMAFSGSGSYYMQQRGMSGSSPTMYPLSGGNAPFQSNTQGGGSSMGSTIPVDTSTMPARAVNVGVPSAAMPQGSEPVRRKRGRPRKYGADAKVLISLPSSSSAPATTTSSTPTQKRGRGRPPGTGRKQQLASIGGWVSSSAGIGFTPHVLAISVGEDIATKIMSFSQQGPRALCVLSANGAISTVTLRQPSSSGGTVTYEGRFEILCLSGSYFMTANTGSHNRIGALSVSLASPDGRIIGGGVGGVLIAASPVQVVLGSFNCGNMKGKNRDGPSTEGAAGVPNQLNLDNSGTPESVQARQTLTSTSSMGIWPSSQQMDL